MIRNNFGIDTFKAIKASRRLTQFLTLVSFLVTFVLVRTITNLQRLDILPKQTGALHVHHLVPGIILILISGYLGMSFWSIKRVRWVMSVMFGVGAALTIDEFALWLYLRDVYWAREGRNSVDLAIAVTAVLTIFFVISEVHGHKWIKKAAKKAKLDGLK